MTQETFEYLEKLSKEEIILKYHTSKAQVTKAKYTANIRKAMIRHFRVRLFKIRNSIDYLLKNPFACQNSNRINTNREYKLVDIRDKQK